MKQPNLTLDPNSPFYRICPSCDSPHMVHNKGRDYCSDKCYQDFYNATRRIKRVAPMYAPPHVESINASDISFREIQYKSIDPIALRKNIRILESLALHPNGTKYRVHSLEQAGFDFNAHSYRYPISSERNIYCIEYGKFETLLVEPDTILIHIKN